MRREVTLVEVMVAFLIVLILIGYGAVLGHFVWRAW